MEKEATEKARQTITFLGQNAFLQIPSKSEAKDTSLIHAEDDTKHAVDQYIPHR